MIPLPRELLRGPMLPQPTQHAMLVVWGHFARTVDLPAHFAQVPVGQKTVKHTPAAKLLTLFLGVLAGNAFLRDLRYGPAPLCQDPAVAAAWGLPAFPDASGVSRTLAAADERALAALQRVLATVSQPFLQRALRDLRTRHQPLLLDADLTGQPVSATSTTYPGAAFGYMDGAVQLGYQLAEICLHTELYGRQWLVGQQHPGDTVSAPCLLGLLHAAEQRLGCHPRRRPELLDQRIAAHQATITEWTAQAERYAAQNAALLAERNSLVRCRRLADAQVFRLQQHPVSPQQSGPYGALTRALRGRAYYERRWARVVAQEQQALRWEAAYRAGIAAEHQAVAALLARQAALAAENVAQPDAPRCILRLDAGFSSGENLTALLELGYEIETKISNGAVIRGLRNRVTADTTWTRVGKNAEMVGWTNYCLRTCPYPLTVALERFHTPQGIKHAVLVRSPTDPQAPCPDLRSWFHTYNQRQTIEAGVKQEKTVFHVQHPWSRSAVGLQIQVALTLFAANFVQWAQEWVRSRLVAARDQVGQVFQSVKQLVRVLANSAATVEDRPEQPVLRFSTLSSLGGVIVHLGGRSGAVQLELPFYEPQLEASG